MKFEKFIATFVMMNIVLLIAVAFSIKNETVVNTLAEIVYGDKVDKTYMEMPPEEQKRLGYRTDPQELFISGMSEIFDSTPVTLQALDETRALPPYERAVAIVRLFSLMGDGTCQTGLTLPEKINKAAEKAGCTKDFAEIFTVLALYTGLDARMVSNGFNWGAEIYDGSKWIFIDPYFAMSVSGQESMLSYTEFSDRMINDGWMRFNYFGGENHCMYGKEIAEHPYFGDKNIYSSIYTPEGNNIFETVSMETELKGRMMFARVLQPYTLTKPKTAYLELASGQKSIVRKYVSGGMAVLAMILIGTNMILPLYYVLSLVTGLNRKK